jgi:hypothetical protein
MKIIVTGGSAGGLAAFLWADYIKNKANIFKENTYFKIKMFFFLSKNRILI